MSETEWSFGLNLFDNPIDAFIFMNGFVYECYVPIKDNKIKFIKNESIFRCLKFYLSKLIDIDEYWVKLTEKQKDKICWNNSILNIDKYWSELTNYQKDGICCNSNNINFNIDKYWNELTEVQKDILIKKVVIKKDN
jgi:hypothetical protein